MENFIDISERLEKDRIILEQKEGLLRKREEDIRHLQDEILELSTPVIEVWEGIITLPLVGTLDSHRAHIAIERVVLVSIEEDVDDSGIHLLLDRVSAMVSREKVSGVIIDLHHFEVMDSYLAGQL